MTTLAQATPVPVTQEAIGPEMQQEMRQEQVMLPIDRFIGKSKAAQSVREFAQKAATVDLNLFISGESGAGKDLVARAIHETATPDGPFILVNCGAVAESIAESEFFGHTKGAFTNAAIDKPGLVHMAAGGTIFLDDIGEMPPATQAKLLGILEGKPFRQVGGSKEIAVNARIIAATWRDLSEMVKKGTFRQDLLYRLRILHLSIPPLRHRLEDVSGIVASILNGSMEKFSPAAIDLLGQYSWPGNVRQLIACIQSLNVLYEKVDVAEVELALADQDGQIVKKTKHFPNGDYYPNLTALTAENPFPKLRWLEKAYLQDVLDSVDGNVSQAAEIAGITRQTMRHKLDAVE